MGGYLDLPRCRRAGLGISLNDWTPGQVKEYIESILNEREKRVTQLERDAKEALNRANTAMEKRLDLLNEFRAQAADEAAKYARREDLESLKERVDLAAGGKSMLISVVSAMLAILAIAAQFVK